MAALNALKMMFGDVRMGLIRLKKFRRFRISGSGNQENHFQPPKAVPKSKKVFEGIKNRPTNRYISRTVGRINLGPVLLDPA